MALVAFLRGVNVGGHRRGSSSGVHRQRQEISPQRNGENGDRLSGDDSTNRSTAAGLYPDVAEWETQ
jgi:hypothetical protein